MPRRNVNGEGNICQRKDGRWEGRTWVYTTDGREIRKSVWQLMGTRRTRS